MIDDRTLPDLVELCVLTDYFVSRYTPDVPCYCGDPKCDRNFASEEDHLELGVLLSVVKAIMARQAK